MQPQRKQVRLQGIVQGVGFRPFIWRLAQELCLSGSVINDGLGVLIEVQGVADRVSEFLRRLPGEIPPLASLERMKVFELEVVADELTFEIRESKAQSRKQAVVPPDVALCPECEREMLNPTDRRFQYPFINCTNCGPRFTILHALPYDRTQTSINRFEMCPECQAEYENPAGRRFHAQANACPECGPQVWFAKAAELNSLIQLDESCEALRRAKSFCGPAALERARSYFHAGKILAIKGIGGFHLACDARNAAAVEQLRKRKQRPAKPLAVMVADLDTARSIAVLDDDECRLLASPARPIMLVCKQPTASTAESVAPGNPLLGIMLAYSPLHRLLVQPGEVWVMTSGNLADEPICRTNEEARNRLSQMCDGFLFHNRPIVTVCDDSVVRSTRSEVMLIRRSRGYCPLPIPISQESNRDEAPCVLAVGGELKTTVCLTVGNQAIVGQHVGDTGNRETLLALERSVEHLLAIYDVRPQLIVADAHPGYLSAQWAARQASRWQIPFRTVQHHHAHAISLACEHHLADEPIIAVVFDGTGFGTDGAVWGGEWLIASRKSFQRFAHLAYTPLPGGDSCIERPAKTALAQLFQHGIAWDSRLASTQSFTAVELRLLSQQLDRNIHCVPSSSMGRLFDAVASLAGLRQRVTYEAQAAVELEFLAAACLGKTTITDLNYPIDLVNAPNWRWDTKPMLVAIVEDCLQAVDRGLIAAKFHCSVAVATRRICQLARESTGIGKVGLTGGVFQNAVLSELVTRELQAVGFEVLVHTKVPPNDGGLSLGQAIIGQV